MIQRQQLQILSSDIPFQKHLQSCSFTSTHWPLPFWTLHLLWILLCKIIKHRLGDTQICYKVQLIYLAQQIKIQNDLDELYLCMIMAYNNISVFYNRLWHYRQFSQTCHRFHENIRSTVFSNYEDSGIFDNMTYMEENIRQGMVNKDLFLGILKVKKLNRWMTELFVQDYEKILEAHGKMKTGAILGFSEREIYKINLIFKYLRQCQELVYEKNCKMCKMMQKKIKKHKYPTTLLKLIFI